MSSEQEWHSSPGQDLRSTHSPWEKLSTKFSKSNINQASCSLPADELLVEPEMKISFCFYCSSPKLPRFEGREGGTAEYQLEIQAQLCHRSVWAYFACSRAAGYPPAVPTHRTAGKSTCFSREKTTHTHTKGLLLYLPPFGSLGCPSPQLTLPRGQDQHQEWERASIPVPGWQCSLAHTAVWHSHTLLPTWKFSQEQERIKERNSWILQNGIFKKGSEWKTFKNM